MKHNSITKKVRLINLRNLIFPLIILIIILMATHFFPFIKNKEPYSISSLSELPNAYRNDELYIEARISALYHTGLEHYVNGRSEGQYYYALENGQCHIFLLSNNFVNKYTPEDLAGFPKILNDISIKAAITTNSKSLSMIINSISYELEWSYPGLSSVTSQYIINELDFDYYKGLIILWTYRILITVSLIIIIHNILCIIFPYLDTTLLRLIRYGRIRQQVKLAEHEISTNILLKQGDFLITDHFLINLSYRNFIVIPLDKIVWAYKFSSYHILRRRRRKITYTLFLHGMRRLSVKIAYLSKTDANTILYYLDTSFPDSLIGYRKEYEDMARKRIASK